MNLTLRRESHFQFKRHGTYQNVLCFFYGPIRRLMERAGVWCILNFTVTIRQDIMY